MTSGIPNLVVSSALGLGVSCSAEAVGIGLEKQESEYASAMKVIGKTGQSLIAVPAVYSAWQAISRIAASKMPELALTFGSGFARAFAYSGAIAFSAVMVIAPSVLEIARIHMKGDPYKTEIINTIDYWLSFGIKGINLVHLVALSIMAGMSAPIALGITLSALTILPTLVEKFG